mgnify:CR=1 FL=1|tara:strand:- start:311 stop:832 length:522 start_codon:yes stop_codon:yes gene_type:complete
MSENNEVPKSNENTTEATNFLSLEEAIEKVTSIAKADNDLSGDMGTAIMFTIDGVKKLLERITPPLVEVGFDINSQIDKIIDITLKKSIEVYERCDFDDAVDTDDVELSFDSYENKINVDSVEVSNSSVCDTIESCHSDILHEAKDEVMTVLFPKEEEKSADKPEVEETTKDK